MDGSGLSSAGSSSKTSLKGFLPSSPLLRLRRTASLCIFSDSMKNRRKCKGCSQFFTVDRRNQERHSYCSNLQCQRARRLQAQKQRRHNQNQIVPVEGLPKVSRLQNAEKPTEAVITPEHPIFIGLVSMLTGSTDLRDIKIVCHRLYERGRDILGLPAGQVSKTPH